MTPHEQEVSGGIWVPSRTVQEITFARDRLKVVSRDLETVGRNIRPYLLDSAVIAAHIAGQVAILRSKLDALLAELKVEQEPDAYKQQLARLNELTG